MSWKMLMLFAVLSEMFVVKGRYVEESDAADGSDVLEETKQDKCKFLCSSSCNGTSCNDCKDCSRQLGDPCTHDLKCDNTKNLVCKFSHGDTEGTCIESDGLSCNIHNKTYSHGETFSLDCRTQCRCQNGTYGCSSLCPQEQIFPEGTCKHPRLVEVPQQCCREWLCDSQTAEKPPDCHKISSSWSNCSSECGSGFSVRQSNLNERCHMLQEVRLCQTRRCENFQQNDPLNNHHHIRRGHECKATHRPSSPVYLEIGPCRSRKRYRPKFCSICKDRQVTCSPLLSTTVKVDFVCDAPLPTFERRSNLIFKNIQQGENMWVENIRQDTETKTLVTVSMQWILRCKCDREKKVSRNSTTNDVVLHRVHRNVKR